MGSLGAQLPFIVAVAMQRCRVIVQPDLRSSVMQKVIALAQAQGAVS